MATREIKTRFKLEGEQEYKRAMSEAAGVIKTLNSEQKLAKAQYEATGDAQQYAADQARILKEQIEQQKKAVSAAEDAVKKLTDNGVDKNADSMRKWRERLNNARTALYNMQTRLNHVGDELGEEEQAFGKAQTAGSNYQNEMEKVNKGIDFQNTITAIDHITGHIETVIKTAAKGAKALWDMGVDAGTWADNIATAASQAGVDPETYQSWQYASRFIDSNVDDIVKNWRDIDNKLIAEGETGQKYLADLAKVGVASINSTTGQLRQGSDIFWDLIDYLNGIGDAEKRTAEATKFFGNDWRRLNPLIEAGSKAYKDLANEGRSVAVVSNENVAALGAVDDAVQDMGARFDKLKYDTLAELAPTFEKTARALSTAITAMDEFVQSAEGQAALAGLNEALSGIIDSFLGKDNGQGTFKAIVEGASGAVKGFTDAMNWIKDNGIVVTGIVAGMGIAWSTLKVTKEVLTFAQLLSGRGTGGGLFSKIFKGKTASAEGLDDATKSFRDAADSFSSSAESAKQAADAAKASAEAGKGAADAAKTSADAAKGSVDAAKASAEAGKAAADAGKASADAANSSAAAANSSSGAAQSASSAVGQSATAAANSATAAADSALGAAEARASLEAGAAGAQESATRAAAARIEAENAAKLANDAANRARLNSGGSGNPLSNLLGSGNGVSIRPQLKIPVGGSGSGGPTFPPMLSNPATPLLGHGAGAVATQTTLLEKVLAALSGGATKLAGGLGLGAYILLKPGKTAGNDLDQLYNDDGSLTTAGREAGLSEKGAGGLVQADWQAQRAAAEAAEAAAKQATDLAKMTAAQGYWDAIKANDPKETAKQYENLRKAYQGDSEGLNKLQDQIEALMLETSDWESLEDLPSDWFEAGAAAAEQLEKAITEAQPKVDAAADAMGDGAVTAADDALGDMYTAGKNAAYGLGDGIYAGAVYAFNAAEYMARGVGGIARNTLEIQSPSKVFSRLGRYTGLGFAEGLDESVDNVDRAMSRMMAAVTRPAAALELPRPALAAGPVASRGAAPGAGGQQPVIQATIVMDKRVVGEMVAPVVNDTIGAVVAAERE